MGLVKHGTGEVLPEETSEQKTASENWSKDDAKELVEENAKADDE